MKLSEFFEEKLNEELSEAMDVKEPEGDLIKALKSQLGAKKVDKPEEIKLVERVTKSYSEWELYYFIQACVFYEVPHKDQPMNGWYNTAAVAPAKGQVIFLFDRPFLEETVEDKYYRGNKEISYKEYKKASDEEKANKEVRAVVDVGKTIFLLAHEAMHIFRYHSERQQQRKFDDPQLYNIAADMVINRQLMNHYGKIGAQDFKFIDGGVILDKKELKDFKEHYNINDDQALKSKMNAEDVYRWLKANAKKKKQQKGQQQEKISREDVFKDADIVKVKKGKYKGEYRKIIKRNNDGSIETAPLDKPIEEIAKERLS